MMAPLVGMDGGKTQLGLIGDGLLTHDRTLCSDPQDG